MVVLTFDLAVKRIFLKNMLIFHHAAITVCNLNPFYQKRAFSKIISYNRTLIDTQVTMTQIPTMNKPEFRVKSGIKAIDASNYIINSVKYGLNSDENISEMEREKMGFTLDDMLISCSFNGKLCDSTDFVYMKSYDYTNCYTFNSGKNPNGSEAKIRVVSKSGQINSLEIELYTGQITDQFFIYKSGAYIVVHNQSIEPMLQSEGIEIATGAQTNLAVKRTFINNLPIPYSDCISDVKSSTSYDSELYRAVFDYLNQTTYRQKFCFSLCYQKLVNNECNCSDPASPKMNASIGYCPYESECMNRIKNTFLSLPVSNLCSDCPLECSFSVYDVIPSTSLYPTAFYSALLSSQSDVMNKFSNDSKLFSTGMLKFNVFYSTMDIICIDQTASYTFDSLLAEIGGQLGLCVGMSFMTIIEICEPLMKILFVLFVNKIKHNRVEETAKITELDN
jgi:hypothetical protein